MGINRRTEHDRASARAVELAVLIITVLVMVCCVTTAQSPSGSQEDGQDTTHLRFLTNRATGGTIPERALAMRKLGRIGFTTILPILEDGLSASDQRLRLAAVDALGEIPLPEANPLLRDALFSDDELVSSSAARAITVRSPEFAVPVFIDGLTHSSASVRSRCRNTLRRWTTYRFDYRPEAPREERRRGVERWRNWWDEHHSSSPQDWWMERIRSEPGLQASGMTSLIDAARHLAEDRRWEGIPALIRLLEHERSPVRIEALTALRTISHHRFDQSSDAPDTVAKRVKDNWQDWWSANGDDGRVSWLLKRLKSVIDREEQGEERKEDTQRDDLVHELISSRQRDIPAKLASMLLGSWNDREAAIRILRGRTGLTFGYETTAEDGERNRAVRRWRAWLERWSNQSKPEWMTRELRQNQWGESRVAAATYFGTVRSRKAVEALIQYGLTDRSEAVREASIVALRQLTGRQFEYRADAPAGQRRARIKSWKEWWGKQDRFFVERGY